MLQQELRTFRVWCVICGQASSEEVKSDSHLMAKEVFRKHHENNKVIGICQNSRANINTEEQEQKT